MRILTEKIKAGKYQRAVWIFAAVFSVLFFQKNAVVQASENSGYIFPDSAVRYMSEEELHDLPLQVLNYGKNEIYARRGRRFRSQELQGYFDGQSWYTGSISADDFDEYSLNDYEWVNAHLINDYEHEISGGYKLDQGGYSYETVYHYLTPAAEDFTIDRSEGKEESKDSQAADEFPDTDGMVQHKSLYGTVTFQLEYQDGGQSLRGVIRAEDIDGKQLWERTTDTYLCAGYAQVVDLGVCGERYYYEESGTIVAVRVADGSILWKSVQALDAPQCCFGSDDMIYLCGYYGPDFVALDRGGQSVQRINSLDADFAYTTAIRYEDGMVYVTKDGSASGQAAKTFPIDVAWMEQDDAEPEETENAGADEQSTEENGTENGQPENQGANAEEDQQKMETISYDDWIRQNMAPSLGICNTGEFSSMNSGEDLGGWLKQSGILSQYEADLDGDGKTEALVVYLKQEKNEHSGFLYSRLCLAVLKSEDTGISLMDDMRCTGFFGTDADMQLFTFEQEGKTYFVLQKFSRFNGVSETLAVFHVADGKIQKDCILSNPGYTSGVGLEKIEATGSEGDLYSDSDYESREVLYDYEYDGRAEMLDCWQNPEYGEALNAQIKPYGLTAAVSETKFEAPIWRLKEEKLTELCRIYASSRSLGMTTDGTSVYKYSYNICDYTD